MRRMKRMGEKSVEMRRTFPKKEMRSVYLLSACAT
jgi:hypothetical protein